jgi:NADH:ubiquinone oxidoreductase subunit 5 (subunit L)/multisubunit Na+/H+ antiporter MnhA subunit
MLIIRLGLFKVAFFHLNIHAMFKSLIFICFGFSILVSNHRQDKRLVSFLNLNPLVKRAYYFSCLCLIGLPFLSAFFSKDFILEKRIETSSEIREIFFLILSLGVRIYYRIKLLLLYNPNIAWSSIEKHHFGIISLFLIITIRVIIINIYIYMIFSVTLEIIDFKFFIYLCICVFLVLSLITNINFNFLSYDKLFNFKEAFFFN